MDNKLNDSTIRKYQTVEEAIQRAPLGVLKRAATLAEERHNGKKLRELEIRQVNDLIVEADAQLRRYCEQ